MGIFNLTPQEEVEDKGQTPVVPLIGDNTEVLDPEISQVPQEGTKVEEEKTVVLEGPLSHIYTQALNLAYAKEGIDMLEKVHLNREDKLELVDKEQLDDSFVYAVDASNMNVDELLAVNSTLKTAVESRKYRKVSLAIESSSVVSSKMQLLCELADGLGIKVYFNRKTALEGILSDIRKDTNVKS
jgi:hypothetical protein